MKTAILLAFLAIGPAAAAPRTNLLVILADDLGWRDTGFAGNRFIETPRLDALAREGVVFKEACASAPNCAPTRACLMTGQYPPRHGVYTVVDERHMPGSPQHKVIAADSRSELATEAVTSAELLRDGGYATGMVGMWNLGRGRRGPTTPDGQGFTFSRQPKELGFENDACKDGNGRFLTDALADEAVSFIRGNKDKPWFLYFAPHAVHAPYDPKPELLEKYRAKHDASGNPAHAATVEELDTAIGRIIDAIASLGMTERTLVVFTSDNGGEPDLVAPLRGGKGSLYQGGLRVPMLVRGPGVKRAVSCDVPVLTMDLFPTLLDYAGIRIPDVDGESLRPLLTGSGKLRRADLFWHFPCYTGRFGPMSAIRHGNFKLLENFETGTAELYDLSKDPAEKENLATQRAEVSRDLLERLHAWQKATHAPRPTDPNPAYDPSARPGRGNPRKGKPKP